MESRLAARHCAKRSSGFKIKFSPTHLDVQRKENTLPTARDEANQQLRLGWEGGVPASGEGDLDCAVLMMHRAGLAHRLLTSAVSFSSAECSSYLATVQGNSRHHQLNTVWSNCTAFVHLYPLFPSLAPQPLHPTSNIVLWALG